jgi:hypothetical protein
VILFTGVIGGYLKNKGGEAGKSVTFMQGQSAIKGRLNMYPDTVSKTLTSLCR